MSGTPVPEDDLPANAVPAGDLPGAAAEPVQTPVQQFNALQKRMGKGRQGDTMGDIHRAREHAIYELGGRVTDLTGSPLAGSLANAAADAATDPLTYVGGGVGKAVQPLAEKGAFKLMWSALKPDKFARTSGDAEKAVKTLLDKGYNVSEGGVEKMTGAIDKLDAAVDTAIANAGNNVKVRDALQPLKDVFNKYRYGGERVANYDSINGEIAKYLDHPEIRRALDISPEAAQEMKRAYYREVGDKGYGLGLKRDAERDAKKGIANGLATGLEKANPDIAPLNAEMGPLINARDLVRDRVLTAMNRNPLGFGAFFNPQQWPVWLLDRNEMGKSILARFLHSGVAPAAPSVGAGVGGGMGTLIGAQGAREP